MRIARGANGFFQHLVNATTLSGRTIAELGVLALIALIVVDVVGRYVFLKPTKVADELGAYMLVGITYFGAAYTLRKGMHIKVTILVDRLSARMRRWLTLLMDSLGLFLVVLLTWQSTKLMMMSLSTDTRSVSVLRTPMFIPELLVPIGLGIFSLEILRQLILQVRDLRKSGGG